MRNPVILMVVCALVLVGAYLASRSLVSEEPAPSAVPGAVVTPEVLQPAAFQPPVPTKTSREEAEEAALLAPPQGPLQHVETVPPVARMEPFAPPVAADIAPSPFQGESKELDYAESMLNEENPGIDRLQSAHQVFSRCVDQEPTNKRCQAGLTTTQNRLGGRVATERTPQLPTLQAPPPHLRAPVKPK